MTKNKGSLKRKPYKKFSGLYTKLNSHDYFKTTNEINCKLKQKRIKKKKLLKFFIEALKVRGQEVR